MKKKLNYYLNLPYDILIKKIPDDEGGGYGSFMPDFKEIAFFYGDGDTPEESLKELKKSFRAVLKSMIEDGDFIPEPKDKRQNSSVSI